MIFDLPKDQSTSTIKVIGVGGAGSNAVTHMFRKGIKGVDFIICNTDKQALEKSPVPNKVQLGVTLTKGRGAGSLPEVGKNSAIESIEDIKLILSDTTDMLFITAGMGGGTGTGAAPIIAQAARELGILTVAIVTYPFAYEGSKRKAYAETGLEELKKYVDSLLVIKNDKLRELFSNLALSQVFAHADDVLCTAAKSISEIIISELHMNIDMNDVNTVMRDSGVAIMGSATVAGEGRAIKAVHEALSSPLLNDNNIVGARHVLLNVISGTDELTIDELGEITDYVQEAAGQTAEIINGYGMDDSLGEAIKVTIIATGFNQANNQINYDGTKKAPEKVVMNLGETSVAQQPVI
jgi:cell division protein FtsZ